MTKLPKAKEVNSWTYSRPLLAVVLVLVLIIANAMGFFPA